MVSYPCSSLENTGFTKSQSRATVSSVLSAMAGNKLKINWQGPGGKYDQIRIVAKTDPGKPLAYTYVRMSKNHVVHLSLPAIPGMYEIHYIGAEEKVLAKTVVVAMPITANLTVPETVIAGAPFQVSWKGPMNQYDRIRLLSIEKPDMNLSYVYAASHKNSKVDFNAPAIPGSYVVQYVGANKRVLAHRMFQVAKAHIKLKHRPNAIAGSKLEVKWSGDVHQYDQIKLLAREKSAKSYFSIFASDYYRGVAHLDVPEKAGTYKIIYVTRGKTVLARSQLIVSAARAAIKPIPPVAPGSSFRVDWKGPANNYDKIRITRKLSHKRTIKADKNPAPFLYVKFYTNRDMKFTAPKLSGKYEVQYITRLNKCLARTTLVVR